MIKFYSFFLFLCIHYFSVSFTKPELTPELKQNMALFFSLFPSPEKTFPEISKLDTAVTLLFGKTLGISGSDLEMIRRLYAYLKQEAIEEFLNKTFSNTDPKKTLNQLFIEAQRQKGLALHHNDKQGVQQSTTALLALNKTINESIKKNLASDIIAACVHTTSWQNHLKVFIANSFSYELQLLSDINRDEIKMFAFLPQFETAYYSTQYTALRNSADYVRLFLILTDTLRSRALTQTNEWKKINDPSDLYTVIEEFKKSDFYTFCQSFDLLNSETKLTPLQNQVLISSDQVNKKYAILKGYRHFLTFTNTNPPQLIAERGMEALFSISNNIPSLTPLGNFLLEEKTIKPIKGDSYPGLFPRPHFFKLFKENENGNGHLPTKLFLELASFNAIRILGSITQYLFNSENLSDTMQALHKLQEKKTLNFNEFPNIILYQPEDQLLLEELNELATYVDQSQPKGATPAGFWDDLWDDIKNSFETMSHTLKKDFEQVGNDLWHTIKDTGSLFVHLAYSVEDIGVGLYYQTGIACLAQGISYSDASSDAGNYFNSAAGQLQAAGNSCINVVNNLTDVAQQVVNVASCIVAQTVGAIAADPRLGSDLENCFDEVAAISIGALRDSTDFLISVGTSMVKLTFEAVTIIEEAALGVLTANEGGLNALKSTSQYFAKDLILSILQAATLFIDTFTDALKSLMIAVGYLTSAVTDLIVDVSGALAGLEALVTGGNFFSADQSLQTEINAHRRLISSIVTLVLMTAITVSTLGTGSALEVGIGIGMLVLGTGMMALNVVGANQQDMQAIYEKKSQEEFLVTFSAYINAIPAAQNALQAQTLNETSQRLKEQEINSERALVYYQNYMNNTLNSLRSSQAYQLSTFYNELLTPDIQNYPTERLLPADTGYVYGIQTNRFDLNPSKGFRVYNYGRNTFAQEIATTPEPFLKSSTQSVFGTLTGEIPNANPHQHFIKQKDLANFMTPDLSVSIRFRIIYETGSDFYIGIYINQNYLDPTFLNALTTYFETALAQTSSYGRQAFEKAWQPLNTFNRYLYNYDHLSKAFVCYKNNQTNNNPALGIYEHSKKEFIVANQQPTTTQEGPWLQPGAWYLMNATFSNGTISVNFAQENNTKISWSSTTETTPFLQNDLIPYQRLMTQINFNPQQLYTGSYGIITSGAAVEYEILNPKQNIKISSARSHLNQQTQQYLQGLGSVALEIDREKNWYQKFSNYCNPSFGNWSLEPFSNLTVAQGVYVYSTSSTHLPLLETLKDYVISLKNPPAKNTTGAGQSLLNSGAVLGQSFSKETQFAISLVTGNAYNNQGILQTTYPDALAAYQKTTQLPQQLIERIQAAQQYFFKNEESVITFENVMVNGIDSALKKGIPVYSCTSFTQYLSGLDYLIFINIPVNGNPGNAQFIKPLSTSNSINSALSLVTGTVFNLIDISTQNQIPQLPPGPLTNIALKNNQGSLYTNMFSATYQPSLSPELVTAITNQINSYAIASAPSPAITLPNPEPQQTAPLNSLSPGNGSCTSIQCIMNSSMNNTADNTEDNFNFS